MTGSLHDARVIVLDCQATGASPRFGHVLELGWLPMSAATEPEASAIVASCVALPEGAEIPTVVRELTGIGPEDVVGAPAFGDLWQRLCADADAIADPAGVALAVVHFARFEHSFLQDLHAREYPGTRLPLRMLCTHEIARRVLPGMPRLGLRALAGYFGHGAEAPRRSHGHVWATAIVWRHLVAFLAERGITNLAALDELLAAPAPRPGRREYPMPKAKRLALPDVPGVYRMLRTSGDVLYVGKATSLRKRVNSYFQKQSNIPDRLLELLSQARDLDVTPTASALEAALLESDEIKRLDPPFNAALGGRERAAWFVGDALDEPSPAADRRRQLGPMGSPWHARRFAALQGAVAGVPAQSGARDPIIAALGWPDAREIDGAVLAAGLERLRATLGVTVLDRPGAMRIGAAWWRDRLAQGVPLVDVDDADDAAEDVPWTADEVHEELQEVIITFARVLRRARWLRALSDSTVAFVDGRAARRLLIARGHVIDRGDQDPTRALPLPTQRDVRERAASFDLATFDRLRVLSTELRRIASTGGPVAVRTARNVVLTGERLQRILAWV